MPSYCCVPGCGGRGGHAFPAKPELREQWIRAVNRKEWTPSKWAIVCHGHFEPEDYETETKEKDPLLRRVLKDGVVPHVFGRKPVRLSAEERQQQTLEREAKFWARCHKFIPARRLGTVKKYTRTRSLMVNNIQVPLKIPAEQEENSNSDSVKVLVVKIAPDQPGGSVSYVSDVPVYRVYKGDSAENWALLRQQTQTKFPSTESDRLSTPYPCQVNMLNSCDPVKNTTASDHLKSTSHTGVKSDKPYPVSLYKVVKPQQTSFKKPADNSSYHDGVKNTYPEMPYPVSLHKVSHNPSPS